MSSAIEAHTKRPPNPQDVSRKLSVSNRPTKKSASISTASIIHSGNESDSDSLISPDPSGSSFSQMILPSSSSNQNAPLSSIAEAPAGSGEESDEDEDDAEAWHQMDKSAMVDGEKDSDLKAGYLWKKGTRRKTWKKRWFVLRPHHLAYYKTSAEYKLLMLLDLNEIHAVTPCAFKRHEHTFGLVSPSRTFYLQAANRQDMDSWVAALNEVRETLLNTSTVTALEAPTPPIPVPNTANSPQGAVVSPGTGSASLSISPLSKRSHSPGHFTSSDDEGDDVVAPLGTMPAAAVQPGSPVKTTFGQAVVPKDPSKTVLSGYLMKCGQKRRTWRKRWFVLTGEKLFYSGSHMDTKPHREIELGRIVDALEYNAFPHNAPSGGNYNISQSVPATAPEDGMTQQQHTFKIITTKRTLLLSAPSETEEIKWLSTVRALIARRASTTTSGGSTVGAQPPMNTQTQTPTTGRGSAGGGARQRQRSASASSGGGGGGSVKGR